MYVIDDALGAAFYGFSKIKWLHDFSKSPAGKRAFERLTERFLAGENLEQAIKVAERYGKEGIASSIAHVGEGVTDIDSARKEVLEACRAADMIDDKRLDADISIKLSHLGYDGSEEGEKACHDNCEKIIMHGADIGVNVEIDMEGSKLKKYAFELYLEQLTDHPQLMVAIQANHRETPEYAGNLTEKGGNLRLVKGAYREPIGVAIRIRREVDTNFRHSLQKAFAANIDGNSTIAIATHDTKLIEYAKGLIEHHITHFKKPIEAYEFQMLHGVREDYLKKLAKEGYSTRVYLPYGEDWFPYVMRRLAERPDNMVMLLRSLLQG